MNRQTVPRSLRPKRVGHPLLCKGTYIISNEQENRFKSCIFLFRAIFATERPLWPEALPLCSPPCGASRVVTGSGAAPVEEDSITLPSQSKGLYLQSLHQNKLSITGYDTGVRSISPPCTVYDEPVSFCSIKKTLPAQLGNESR